VVSSTAEEATTPGPGESPDALCLRNARAKAVEVARRSAPDTLVLGADTIVVVDGEVLGKPSGAAEAAAMLRLLSGRAHRVLTGVVLLPVSSGAAGDEPGSLLTSPGGAGLERVVSTGEAGLERVVSTDVVFKTLTAREIDGYLATGEPFDKAGAYGIQGIGAFLVTRIDGSYTNVVGLPLTETLELLEALGGPPPFSISGADLRPGSGTGQPSAPDRAQES
jgi:septum formation protein